MAHGELPLPRIPLLRLVGSPRVFRIAAPDINAVTVFCSQGVVSIARHSQTDWYARSREDRLRIAAHRAAAPSDPRAGRAAIVHRGRRTARRNLGPRRWDA